MNLCQCGCGQECKRKFVNGHNSFGKNNPFYNKKHTEETLKKMSELNKGKQCGENNPFYNKKHTEETRKKMSESHKDEKHYFYGKKFSEEHLKHLSECKKGKNHPMYGKHHSSKSRIQISKSLQGKHDGKNNPMYGKTGENCPTWKGGASLEPYCSIFKHFDFRSIIYERDTNNCQLCGMSKQLSYKLFGRNLCIHHIDGDKKNCDTRNCTLLCTGCNTRVENKINGPYYEDLFRSKMKGGDMIWDVNLKESLNPNEYKELI